MAFGMVFTLAFLPVGLIVALIIVTDRAAQPAVAGRADPGDGRGIPGVRAGRLARHRGRSVRRLELEPAPPRAVLRRISRGRTGSGSGPTAIELAIAIGLPTVVWCVVGLFAPRSVPRVVWATLVVLVLVNLTGRNMGEVARLWMLFTPPFLIAAARGLERLGGGPVALAASSALVGFQTLALQAMIQVVYPV